MPLEMAKQMKVQPLRKIDLIPGKHQIVAVLPVIGRSAAHLHPGSEFRDAAGGVIPGELLQHGHECRIILDLRDRLIQNRPNVNPFLPGT